MESCWRRVTDVTETEAEAREMVVLGVAQGVPLTAEVTSVKEAPQRWNPGWYNQQELHPAEGAELELRVASSRQTTLAAH